jgi:hypothetical protein
LQNDSAVCVPEHTTETRNADNHRHITGYANTPHLAHNEVSPEKPGLETKVSQNTQAASQLLVLGFEF